MGRAYLAISIVTVLWATNFTVAKIGTRELDPFFIAAFRVFATSAVFYAFLPRDQRRLAKSDIKAFLPLALTGIVTNHICFASGIKYTTPSHSAVIHALVPVFVALSGWILIREKLGPVGMIGMALAVAGALVVVLRASAIEFRGTLLGDILTTIGIIGFSVYTVLGRDRVSRMGGFRVVTFAFVFAIPFMIPALFYGVWRQDWNVVTWKGWTALAYMFLCANLICYMLHIFALSRLTAGQVAAFTDLQPAIGIGVAVLLGEDHLTATLIVGSLIALAGVVLVQFRR